MPGCVGCVDGVVLDGLVFLFGAAVTYTRASACRSAVLPVAHLSCEWQV